MSATAHTSDSSHLPFPKDLAFDRYRAAMTSDLATREKGDLRHALTRIGVSPTSATATLVQQMAVDTLDRCKIFVLTPEALDCVLDTAARLHRRGAHVGPLVAPAVPMWVEFEAGALHDQTANRSTRALWYATAPEPTPGAFQVLRVDDWVDAPGFASPPETPVEDVFAYSASTTSWLMKEGMGCPHTQQCPSCLLARQPDGVLIRQHADEVKALEAGCLCYEDGREWAHFHWVLFAMLRAEGAQHTVVDRRMARIRIRTPKPNKAERIAQTQRDTYNATHPLYVRIALNQRIHIRRDQRPDGASGVVYELDADAEKHATTVIGHWRLLIPAPEKPWRGEQPRVIWVRSHERYVHGKRRVRYHVTP